MVILKNNYIFTCVLYNIFKIPPCKSVS